MLPAATYCGVDVVNFCIVAYTGNGFEVEGALYYVITLMGGRNYDECAL